MLERILEVTSNKNDNESNVFSLLSTARDPLLEQGANVENLLLDLKKLGRKLI